jgi:hypothetical protein
VCSYKWPSLGILLSSTIEAFPQKDSGPFFSQPSPKINISSFAFQEFPQPFFADRLFAAIPSVPQEWSEDFTLGNSPGTLYDSCRELLSLPPKKSSGSEKPKPQERAG